MKLTLSIIVAVAVMSASQPAFALDDPIVFPKEGQSKEQLITDKAFCKTWAEDETGVNPDRVASRIDSIKEDVTTDKQTKFGGLLEGVFKGAATGAVVGTIDKNVGNEVGRDAAKGAVLGGVLKHEKQGEKAEELEYRKGTFKKEDLEKEYGKYMRAYSACLEAKGYTVK